MVKWQTIAQHISTLKFLGDLCSKANKAFLVFFYLRFKEIENVTIFMIVKCKVKMILIVLCEMLH